MRDPTRYWAQAVASGDRDVEEMKVLFGAMLDSLGRQAASNGDTLDPTTLVLASGLDDALTVNTWILEATCRAK